MLRVLRNSYVRFAISALLLGYILYHIERAELLTSLFSIDPAFFALACAAFATGQMLNSVRWKMLIMSVGRGPDPAILDLFALNLVGMYYNFFAPSTIGGDVLQAETARRYVGGRRDSYISIVLNRVIALFAIVAIAMGCIAAALLFHDELDPVLAMIELVLLLSVPGVGLLFLGLRNWRPGSQIRRSKPYVWAVGIWKDVEAYVSQRGVIWNVFLLAIVSNLVGQVVVVWIIGAGMGIDVPAFYHFVFVPVIILATLVPVTLNGFGIREAAFVYLYGRENVSPADAVAMSVVLTGLLVVFGLVGGLATLLPRYRLSLD